MDDNNIESIFIRELNQSLCDYHLDIIKIDANINCQRMLDLLDGQKNEQKRKLSIIETIDNDKNDAFNYGQNDITSLPVKQDLSNGNYINLNISPVKPPVKSWNVKNELSVKEKKDNYVPKSEKQAFQVIYGKYKPYKKNKEWSYDGFLIIKPQGILLYNISGRIIARIDRNGENIPRIFSAGTTLVISQWECEIQEKLVVSEFESGAFFITEEEI